ncbi:MAG: hypothetical protein GY822_00350 [Deltaproteobacteria bacterium]|nr:hypothetical protein [Deltaproteobacteria bacterium]
MAGSPVPSATLSCGGVFSGNRINDEAVVPQDDYVGRIATRDSAFDGATNARVSFLFK